MENTLSKIIAAAVLPSAVALAFFYGFAFRLSVFGTVGIPLQWLSLTYLENAVVGSPLLYEVLRIILSASGAFFIVKFLSKRDSLSILVGFGFFFGTAYHLNHAPCGRFIIWMVVFCLLVGGAAWRLNDENPQMRTLFFTTVVLLYFGCYGIDQAVFLGKANACNNERTILTIDSRDYIYFGTFGEFSILREKGEAKYSLVAFPSKDTQRDKYSFQTKEVALPECPVEKQEFPYSWFLA